MSVAFETLQIPQPLYRRLWNLAAQEKTEPVRLIERWLERALDQADEDVEADTVAPIYHLHEYAEDLGVTDLAQNVDHYLYGHEKQ